MDRWRRWRAHRPGGGRLGAPRAGVTALGVLVVTAGLAVLLAVLFHLAWPPVLVAIVGALPALYLAWLAVPGVIRPPEPAAAKLSVGRLVGRWDPVGLGVHQVIGGGPMPTYVGRPHDELLRAVLDQAVRASRLVVVRGGSSTGKTRAAYEAVAARLADWQLDYPLDPGALSARLEAGLPARTVLWLGELRQYADAEGGAAVLARLADLLQGEDHLLITTLWPEQWATYTTAARAGPGTADPAGTAGRLLERLPELTGADPARVDPARGGVIDVPTEFTAADLDAAARAGDPLLAEAAAAASRAGQGGQVTQYLAGVPDLLDRYGGPGGDPYGQAVLTAALDATHLGHATPLPAALLQEAAVGYLTGPQRTKPLATWRDTALAWATAELHGAVRALQPIPPPAGTGVVGYQVADYLNQHASRIRQEQLGPSSLWDALLAHTTSASDLERLAQAAQARGLYRHAAAFWTAAATVGGAYAAHELISHLRQVSPGDITRVAHWTADHASRLSLDSPWAVAELLRDLRKAGAGDAIAALATRAASHASIDQPAAVAELLRDLREAGAGNAAAALATRAASHISLDDADVVASLLRELSEAGAGDAVAALLARDPAAHASVDQPAATARLMGQLRAAGADDAAAALAARAANHFSLDDPGAVAWALGKLREAGADQAVTTLLARDPTAHVSLDNPESVAALLAELRAAGADQAVAALLARDPAAHVWLDDPGAVAWLLAELRAAGAGQAVAALLARDPAAHVSLDNPGAVAWLLAELRAAGAGDAAAALAPGYASSFSLDDATAARYASLDNPADAAWVLGKLREAGAGEAVAALLARDPAAHASLDDLGGVAWLLAELRAAGAGEAVAALLARDPAAHASLDDPRGIAELLWGLRAAGAGEAVAALLARDPAAHASLDNPESVAALLAELRAAGADQAVTALATRTADAGMFDLFLEACPDEAASHPFGREPDGTPSQPWKWQEPAS
jgi:hypothetical protein